MLLLFVANLKILKIKTKHTKLTLKCIIIYASVRTDETEDIKVQGWRAMCGKIFLEITIDFYLKFVL